MCGLVGVMSSNMLMKHKDVLASLIYLNTWRGQDSTGVATIRHNGDTDVLKTTVPGYEFIEGPRFEKFLNLNDIAWIGHNRFGTVGKNTKANAHPFTVDDDEGNCILVGAHNGTLKNKYQFLEHDTFGTDSEALFNEIAVNGLEKTIAKTEGAYALTFYDHFENRMSFIKNKERPLFYAWEKGKKTLFWASEQWMLRIATSRHGCELEDDKVYAFLDDTLYWVDAPLKLNDELTLGRKGGLVGKAPTFFLGQNHGRTYAPAASRAQTNTQGAVSQAVTLIPPSAAQTGSKSGTTPAANGVTPLLPKPLPSGAIEIGDREVLTVRPFKGFAGERLNRAELLKQLSGGCAWCEQEFIDINEPHAWLAPSEPVCVKCLRGVPEEEVTPLILQHKIN